MSHPTRNLALLVLVALTAFQAAGQAPNGAWAYPSATGNLLYQLDERGQRIADFSNCGYRGGTEPLPNVAALIPPSRWVYVSPGAGDDTALIQAAIDSVEALTLDANGWRGVVYLNAGEYQLGTGITINASGVVLKGAGDSSTTGTRLRATATVQYNLISVSGSGSRSTVANTTRNLTQKLVPAGTRTFQVDSTSGLAVGHTVIVKRPSTANWIADMDMDQLGPAPVVPWTAGSKDLLFDRTITRISGNWITVDVPLPQTFETMYGGGQIWRYTWTGRIQQVGIEDIYGFSDYASSTDEAHAWKCIQISNAQHVWVRNITAQYFGYAAVSVSDGAKWLTVADSQCLDPISEITGGRRYSFNNDGAECTLFVNNYTRKGRHDFVFGATVPGPNAFVHCTADTAYSDTGPHHRWSVGGLFDLVTVNGNQLNVRNRGNSGTGHGWAGAYMAVWNCTATSFSVRNPPTARNWLVGSIGTIATSSGFSVGADPAGTYDSSGPSGTGKAVYPRSLYHGQLQQRMKWPDSEFRETWLGDVDQHTSDGGTGETVNCDPTWLSQVETIGALPAVAKFDELVGNRHTACTLDFLLDPGDTVVAASLTVSLRGIGSAATDSIWLDNTASPQTYASLGWTPISTTAPTVRTMEVTPALLADGRLNLAFGTNTAVDFATLHLQVQKAQPSTQTITLTPVADAYVQGGTNANTNYGTATTLVTKVDTDANFDRETFLRWDLSAISGKIVQAKVRLAGSTTGQAGNENCATQVTDDNWDETTINFTNKPAAGKLFAQWLPVAGQPAEFNVTPQVVDTLLGDGNLSLCILSTDNFGTAGIVNYASRENSTVADHPQLILTIIPPVAAIKAATGSALNLGTAWTPASVPVDPDTATWNATSLTGAMTLGADLNWGGLTVNDPAGPLTFNGTQTLTLGSGGIDLSAATVNLTLNHPVMLGEDQIWNVGTGRTLAATRQISGSCALTKSGTGTLTLTGLSATAASNHTGTTTIGGGTLAISANDPSFTGGLTFGSANASAILGSLDLSNTSTTYAGAALVRTNNVSPNTVLIGSAQTLTLSGGMTLGYDAAGGSGATDSKLTVTGGGSMVVNGTTISISVNQAAQNAGYSSRGTLDVSALAAFNTNVTNFNIGVGSTTTGVGNMLLSNTANTIQATTLTVANTGGNNGNGTSTLTLGTGTNLIQADTIEIGKGKGSSPGMVKFASQIAGSPGTVTIADKAGTAAANITVANVNGIGTSGGAVGTLDLRGHTATVDAGTLLISRNNGGNGTAAASTNGTVHFDAGTFTVATLNIAQKSAVATGTATGTLNVGGGAFTVNTAFTLGSQTGSGASVATLNLTGGTFTSNAAITQGGGSTTSTINLDGTPATTTLDLTGREIGTLANPIAFNAKQGTLQNVSTINGTGGLTKTTAGTLVLAGTNTYTGNTTLSGGTLALGANHAVPATALSIGSATLNAATFTDNLGTLDVTGSAVINLGIGAKLAFADSSAVDWAGGALAITGTLVLGGPNGSLRFGTTSNGLTDAQLALITKAGEGPFDLDADGFLIQAGYSAWQTANLTTQTIDLDHDNDGVSNGIEYFRGGSTNTTGFTPLPSVINTAGVLSITWTKHATYSGTYGTDFLIQTSATLNSDWATEASPGTVTITDSDVKFTFPAGAKNFARLKVTGP